MLPLLRIRTHVYRRLLLILTLLVVQANHAQDFHITRLQYAGGGDWYSDPSSLPNLINFIREETSVPVSTREFRTKLSDSDLYSHPYLYMTGHGQVKFSNDDVRRLREYLIAGGFLHADDNYGMDKSFRREMKRVFPDKEWVELPFDHPLFNSYYTFSSGLPKIHEHDGKPPQALALFHQGRMIVLYTYESDLGDGWEDIEVHNDGIEKHHQALRMGTNIVIYALSN